MESWIHQKWEEATFTNSFMFRLVMEREDLCKKLIERLMGIKIKSMNVPIMEKDFRVDGESRGIRLDVYVEDADGVTYDIEMQTVSEGKEYLGLRARYYQSIIDAEQMKRNVPFSELRRSVIIFICTFDPYDEGRPLYEFSNLCSQNKKLAMGDETVKLYFNATGNRKRLSKDRQNFLAYVNGETVTGDSFVDELRAAVDDLHLDSEKRAIYMTYKQELLFQQFLAEKKGALKTLISLVQDKLITIGEAAKRAGMSEVEFAGMMNKA